MSPVSETELLALRLTYQAAYSAYQTCMDALARAGNRPPQKLLDDEGKALRQLTEARRAYRDALLATAFTPVDPWLE